MKTSKKGVNESPSQPRQAYNPADNVVPPSVHDKFGTAIAEQTNPRQVQEYLELANSGDPEAAHRVYVRMEDTWDRLAKNIHELRTAAAHQAWTIEPFRFKEDDATPEAEEKARFVEDALRQMEGNQAEGLNGFQDMLYDVTDAVGKGISVQEIAWKSKDGFWVPNSTRWVDPRYYGSDPNGHWLGLRNIPQQPAWQPFPDNMFIQSAFKNRSGNILGYGLFRQLAWWWAAGVYGRQWLVRHAELFGIPFRVARHQRGADPGEVAQIVTDLENMGAAGIAVVPEGTEMDLLESAKSASENPQAVLLDRRDRSADILILGQTLTTDVGDSGSRALGEVHETIRLSRLVEVSEWASDCVTDCLIRSIVKLNWGNDDELPKLKIDIPDRTDPIVKINRDEIASRFLPIPKRWLYERHGIPEPSEGEETVMSLAPQNPGFSGATALQANAGDVAPKGDKLLNAAIEEAAGISADWLDPIKPKLAIIFAMAQKDDVSEEAFAAAVEKLYDDVPGLFDLMGREALADSIEKVTGAAVVNGAVARMKSTKGAEELFAGKE